MATIRKRTWTYAGRKRTAYEFSIVHDGKRTRKQFPTRAEAQDELDKFKDDLKNPVAKAMPTITFGEAFARLLELKARRPRVAEYRKIARHLESQFGKETPLAEITAERISAYKAQRLGSARVIGKGENAIERPLSAAAVNRPLALLRHLLRLARKWKFLAEVPEIELEKGEKKRLRWLRPEEASRLLEACLASRNPVLADLVQFSLFTGLRQSEALGLTWDRVERARGVVLLEETKNGERREVPLSAAADAVLARRWTPESAGYVFGSPNWNTHRTAWEAAVRRTKITNLRFHDLRHTFASWLAQKGRPLKEIQEALGHKSLAMTMRYAHLSPDNLRAAVASLDGILPSVPSPDGARLAQETHASRHQPRPIGDPAVTSRA